MVNHASWSQHQISLVNCISPAQEPEGDLEKTVRSPVAEHVLEPQMGGEGATGKRTARGAQVSTCPGKGICSVPSLLSVASSAGASDG